MKKQIITVGPRFAHQSFTNRQYLLVYGNFVGIPSEWSSNQVFWYHLEKISEDELKKATEFATIRILAYPKQSYITMCDDFKHFEELITRVRGKITSIEDIEGDVDNDERW